jgi:Tol biopolymer transport system component
VAFASAAANLVPEDTNGTADVFVRDLSADTTERASVTSAGEQALVQSRYPVISGNGRYVVFASQANLDPGDQSPQTAWDLYRRDLSTSTTELVNADAGGTLHSQAFSPVPAVSGDGRFVAWKDFASPRLLVKDMGTGSLDAVAVPVVPTQLGDIWDPLVSDDGHILAFVSSHAHVAGQANVFPSVFALDRGSGAVERIALGTAIDTIQPVLGMSADGSVVAYATRAPLLVPDSNATWDVYAHVRTSPSSLWLVSVGVLGTASSGPQPFSSGAPFVSADGSTVVYTSTATNLVGGIAAGESPQVFVRATFGGRTTQLTACDAEAGNATSGDPSLSGDGQIAAFWSVADNLLGTPGSCTLDTNGKIDVFVAR